MHCGTGDGDAGPWNWQCWPVELANKARGNGNAGPLSCSWPEGDAGWAGDAAAGDRFAGDRNHGWAGDAGDRDADRDIGWAGDAGVGLMMSFMDGTQVSPSELEQ